MRRGTGCSAGMGAPGALRLLQLLPQESWRFGTSSEAAALTGPCPGQDLRGMRRAHLIAAAVLVVVALAGVLTLGRTLRHPSAVAEMRGTVAALRPAADSCRLQLEKTQQELLDYNAQLHALHGRVRGMEQLHPRGVPADSYSVYLELFGLYNDSAGVWDRRVSDLGAEQEACRVRVDAHNVALDSLRALLRESRR
jgi:hypothetical protein